MDNGTFQATVTVTDGDDSFSFDREDFREHLGGELTVTLLSAIGLGVEVHEMNPALVLEAIAWLKEREAG